MPHLLLQKLFRKDEELVLLDVGSCDGRDSIAYAKMFPKSKVFAFEALPSNIPIIEENVADSGLTNIELVPVCLADKKDTMTFHVSSGNVSGATSDREWNMSSSLLAPDEHLEHFPEVKFDQSIEVETDTLQSVLSARNISQVDFMHLDVQGAELMVLRGAGDLLPKINSLWLEVEAVSLYKNQPLKKDVESFLNAHAFIKLDDAVGRIYGEQFWVRKTFLQQRLGLLKTWKTQIKNCWQRLRSP